MADKKGRTRFRRGGDDSSSPSIFDMWEPPPEEDGVEAKKIPVVRSPEPQGGSPAHLPTDTSPAAEAEAAGLRHWSEPPSVSPGGNPRSSRTNRSGVRGPTWRDEDPNWDGDELSEVFANTGSMAPTPLARPSADTSGLSMEANGARTHRLTIDRTGSATDRYRVDRPMPDAATVSEDRPGPTGAISKATPVHRELPSDIPSGTASVPIPMEPAPSLSEVPQPAGRGERPPPPSHNPGTRHGPPVSYAPDVSPRQSRPSSPSPPSGPGPTPLVEQDPVGADVGVFGKRRLLADAPMEPEAYGHDLAAAPLMADHTRSNGGEGYREDYSAGGEGYQISGQSVGYPSEDDKKGRGLSQRLMVGIGLIVIVGVAMAFGPLPALVLICLVTLLASIEAFGAMRQAGLKPATLLGIVGAVALPAAAYVRGEAAYPLVVALVVVFGMLWYLTGADVERPVLNLGLTIMGVLWIGGLAGFGALLIEGAEGVGLLVAAIAVTAVSDSFAYFGGKSYGTRPFHSASPNKTWEGTITGFFGALLVGLVLGATKIISAFDGQFTSVIVFSAVVGILAVIGDLSESLVKRDLGIKDMGTILPGHGGILDRVDALLFTLPGAYYVAIFYQLI